MHSGSGFFPTLLLRGSVFLILVSCSFAQGPRPVPSAAGAIDSVEAPVPTGANSGERAGVESPAQRPDESGTGNISGTATDENGDLIPGSIATLESADHGDHRTVQADDNGSFDFHNLKPGIPYTVLIQAKGFAPWTSSAVTLSPGQFEFLKDIQLRPLEVTTITVVGSTEQIAVEQVQMAEKQRVLGFIPISM
jgi:hypothetical protein